ncbi:MAG: CHASE3 domain-containing protein [Steroidobacteraceae bacterium]
MDKRLLDEKLNRKYVLLPLLLIMLLVILGFTVSEMRRTKTAALNAVIRERQEVLRMVSETLYQALDSESAQRGFLLTGEKRYQAPFNSSVDATRVHIAELENELQKLLPGDLPVIRLVKQSFELKVGEMAESMRLMEAGRNTDALALIKADAGLGHMNAIRNGLEILRRHQREDVQQGLSEAHAVLRINTGINLLMTVFTLGVLLLAGLLVSRDLRRRAIYFSDLNRRVAEATHQIRDLTRHMARIGEVEKHALARELHDELGGLLISLRMDIVQLRRTLFPKDDADVEKRWARVEQALSAGIDLKRRVIEQLRPTLLDNMGLFTALRWQAEETCNQAGLEATLHIPEEDHEFPPDVAIGVFRTFQEALTNVARHAGARHLLVDVRRDASGLVMIICDDGIGLPPDAETRGESHGVKQMRFRIESLGGTFRIYRRDGRGTAVEIFLPDTAASG